MHFFITGTDTDIGKTVVSAWICQQAGYHYWKPIQTGSIEGTDSDFVRLHTSVLTYETIYSYKEPLSPHLTAKLENKPIDLENISISNLYPYHKNSKENSNISQSSISKGIIPEKLIIEGAGGVFTPLNSQQLIIDLIKKLGIQVLLVCKSGLGTINHTLLTLSALKDYDIPVAGIIMNGTLNENNRLAIEHYGKMPVIAELPYFRDISSAAIGRNINKNPSAKISEQENSSLATSLYRHMIASISLPPLLKHILLP